MSGNIFVVKEKIFKNINLKPTYIIDLESLGGWFTLIERVLALVYLLQARPLCVKYVDGRRTVVYSTRRSIIRPAWQLSHCPAI